MSPRRAKYTEDEIDRVEQELAAAVAVARAMKATNWKRRFPSPLEPTGLTVPDEVADRVYKRSRR
mgnify:CR=1 FL=1